MSDDKILLIGASGAVGSHIFDYISARSNNIFGTFNSNGEFLKSNFYHLDLSSPAITSACIHLLKPSVVVFCAGFKDLRKCQSDPIAALQTNALCIEYLHAAFQELNYSPLFIYLSTDYVFAGDRGGYTFADNCEPNTSYGLSKLLGEHFTKKLFSDHLILRSSAIMTPGAGFFGWINRSIVENQPIRAFDNIFFSPTPIAYLCEVLCEYISSRSNMPQRLFHCSSNIRLSRYEFIARYASIAFPGKSICLTPLSVDLNNSIFRSDLSICDGTKLSLQSSDSLNFEMFCNV